MDRAPGLHQERDLDGDYLREDEHQVKIGNEQYFSAATAI
jgi:hypothetical protein